MIIMNKQDKNSLMRFERIVFFSFLVANAHIRTTSNPPRVDILMAFFFVV